MGDADGEDADGEEAGDDGRRKLLDLASDVSGAVDKAKDTAKEGAEKIKEGAEKVVDKGNDTARAAVDKVTDVVCNVSEALNGTACANATNETMANGTEMAADTIDGEDAEAGDDGRRKLLDLTDAANAVTGAVSDASDAVTGAVSMVQMAGDAMMNA